MLGGDSARGGRFGVQRLTHVACPSLWAMHMVVNKTHPMGLITRLEVVGCFKLRCIAPPSYKSPGLGQGRSRAILDGFGLA